LSVENIAQVILEGDCGDSNGNFEDENDPEKYCELTI
jgi:hypothetical protein